MNWQQKSGVLLAMVLGSMSLCHAANSPDACHTLRKHGQQAEAKSCYESLVRTQFSYLHAEGYWGLEQYDQANEEFRIATAQPGSDPLYKVRWGMLLHERFNNTDAVGSVPGGTAKRSEERASLFRTGNRQRRWI